MKHHDRRANGIRCETLWLLAVHTNELFGGGQGDHLLATTGCVLEHSAHVAGFGTVHDGLANAMGAEASGCRDEIDGLKQAGFSLPVVAEKNVHAAGRNEIDGAKVAQGADGKLAKGDWVQIRIGMTTPIKLLAGSSVAGLTTAGSSSPERSSEISSSFSTLSASSK